MCERPLSLLAVLCGHLRELLGARCPLSSLLGEAPRALLAGGALAAQPLQLQTVSSLLCRPLLPGLPSALFLPSEKQVSPDVCPLRPHTGDLS